MGPRDARFEDYGAPLAIGAMLIAAIWALTFITLAHLRRSAEADAAAMRRNLANSLAEREASSVRAIDISLLALRDAWLHDPRGFDDVVARHERLLRRERVIQTAVVDAEGWLLYSRLPWPGRLNFSDRGYFQEQRTHAQDDRLRVSEPIMGRVTREWAIQLTRPILVDGRFAGLVVFAVPPPALEQVYREIDLGPDGVVSLARKDGQILARSTALAESLGAPMPPLPAAAASTGHFSAPGHIDGIRREVTYREIDDYGLVIYVGQSIPAVLAPYVRERNYLLAFATGGSVLVLCIALLVALRRRDEARYRAAQERMMLELHDGCIQAIYAVGLGLQGTRRLVHERPGHADAAIAQAEADLNLVIQELRAFIGAQKPERLAPTQLVAEIERSLPRAGHTCFDLDLQPAALVALDAEQGIHVLRIIREATANVERHANATRARIYLGQEDGEFRLDVTDDGEGIAAGGSRTGLGLAHIEARAEAARRLGDRPRPRRGNASQCTIPLQTMIKLLIVDDHEMVRAGLRTLLERVEDFDITGEVRTAAEAVEACTRLEPDVVLMDLRLPDGSGVGACREILSLRPRTRVLFLTSYAEDLARMSTVLAGAAGYLLKDIVYESLVESIRDAAAGRMVVDPAIAQSVAQKLENAPALSKQECQVLALVVEGKTNKQIGVELGLSEKTVRNYLSNAFQKLGVARRSQAAVIFSGGARS